MTAKQGLSFPNYRFFAGFSLLLADLISLFIAACMIYILWSSIKGDMPPDLYTGLIPLLLLFPLVYFLAGLYPGIGVGPVDELRRLTMSTSAVYLIIGALSFFLRNAEMYSRATFGLSFMLSLLLVPLGRHILRALYIRAGWWGEPVALIGFGNQGTILYNHLINNPSMGLKPVVVINGFNSKTKHNNNLAVVHLMDILNHETSVDLVRIQTALLVTSEISQDLLHNLITENRLRFKHLIMVSEEWIWGTVSIIPYDLGGILGLEVKQNLLNKGHQIAKRILDIGLVIVLSPIWIPLLALCSLMICLDSPGKVFFIQIRNGQGGKKIKLWKLRTMHLDADAKLEIFLAKNPTHRDEWESNQKLRDDIRITRVGKILRRLSLDELPQFWNVVLGDMSLVGPRPIVDNEIARYGLKIELIRKVKPGISGLWQVSGRNDIEYEQRVVIDEYYVRNWSIWLDLYIIMNTFTAILSGKGAY